MLGESVGTIGSGSQRTATSRRGRQAPVALPSPGLRSPLDSVFPLLLAVTDDELAGSAIRVTAALARSRGAIPTVIRAFEENHGSDVVVSAFVGAMLEGSLSPEYRSEEMTALQSQVTAITGPVRWRWEVTDRHPIEAITDETARIHAGLIVMGLARHGILRRAVSRDALRGVAAATRTPILAVRPELTDLPRRVIVAVDFGEASVRAAALARHIMADDGELYLVHVMPDEANRASHRISPLHKHGPDRIAAELESMVRDLAPSPNMTIRPLLLDGDVQLSIRGAAYRYEADMVATGSDRHSTLDRLLAASVSMGLAHTARWSTLVVPSRHSS